MKELNDSNYTSFVTSMKGVLFIDFYTPSCSACQEIMPLMPHVENYFKDEDVTIAMVDVSVNPKLAKKYEISSVPFCVSIGEDKMVKDYELGASSVDRYVNMVKKAQGKKGFFARLFG
jgi:thiol-disulfide isomerase/thioredoxin